MLGIHMDVDTYFGSRTGRQRLRREGRNGNKSEVGGRRLQGDKEYWGRLRFVVRRNEGLLRKIVTTEQCIISSNHHFTSMTELTIMN
jgi:hypothetical protein